MSTLAPRRPRRLLIWGIALIGTCGLAFMITLTCFSLTIARAISAREARVGMHAADEAPPSSAAPEGRRAAADFVADLIHEGWVQAMLTGQAEVAEAIYAVAEPQQRREDVERYLALTKIDIVMTEVTGGDGRFLDRYEIVGALAGADDQHRVGLSRLLFEGGSACFETRLVRRDTTWQVERWGPVAMRSCDELAAQPEALPKGTTPPVF